MNKENKMSKNGVKHYIKTSFEMIKSNNQNWKIIQNLLTKAFLFLQILLILFNRSNYVKKKE